MSARPLLGRVSDALRHGRKAFKAALPFVRRREYRILRKRHDALVDAFTAHAVPARDAVIVPVKALAAPLQGEVCFFVTHAAQPRLKPHVLAHIQALAAAGFQVVLIANSDLPAHALELDAALLDQLAACFVRANVGFDFAAWGHAYALCGDTRSYTRLLLVNDSVIGPVDLGAFGRMLQRLRSADADLVGLTENTLPHRHLQSFFLALGPRALQSEVLRRVMAGMHSLPTKELVIDAYETALTRQLVASGLRSAVLFPALSGDPHSADDTMGRWRELLDAGFPYVKASLLASGEHGAAVRAALPPGLMPSAKT